MTTARPQVSQYTPTDEIPPPGEVELHPHFRNTPLQQAARPSSPAWTPRELRDLTRYLATELAAPLLDVVEVDEQQRWWTRLALTSGVEVWLLTWAPGQGTEPHDHGGAAGSFAVLFGALREDHRYPPGPSRSTEHALGAALGFGAGRAHQLRNTSSVNSASVHAYSPPLLPVRHYNSLDDVPPQKPARTSADAEAEL